MALTEKELSALEDLLSREKLLAAMDEAEDRMREQGASDIG